MEQGRAMTGFYPGKEGGASNGLGLCLSASTCPPKWNEQGMFPCGEDVNEVKKNVFWIFYAGCCVSLIFQFQKMTSPSTVLKDSL